jgi:hypothetical protein
LKGFADLWQRLLNQYELWFDRTSFYKVFEDAGALRRHHGRRLNPGMHTPGGW